MGYSIYTIAKDEKTAKRMFDFMSVNMKSFNKEVLGNDNDYIGLTNNLSYTAFPKKSNAMKKAVGFDYNAGGAERFYAYQLMRWMAVKIGNGVYYYDCEKEKIPAQILSVAETIKDSAAKEKKLFDESGNVKPIEYWLDNMKKTFWDSARKWRIKQKILLIQKLTALKNFGAMTKLQKLQEEKRKAKHQMFIHRPNKGYLGNQYYYWEKQWEKAKSKIEKLLSKKSFRAVTKEGKEIIKKSLSKQDWDLIKNEIEYNFTKKEFDEERYLYFVLGLEVSENVMGEWFPVLEYNNYDNGKFGKVQKAELKLMIKYIKNK